MLRYFRKNPHLRSDKKGYVFVKNKLIHNATWIVVGQIIRMLLSVGITMLTARYLGPQNYGTINYAAGLVAFAAPLMKLGLNAILVRELVNRPKEEGEILGTVTGMNLLSSVLCIIGITAFAAIANRGEEETILVCVIYSFLLFFQALEMVQYWYQAKLLSKYYIIASMCAYLCTALFKVFLLVTKKSVYWFSASNSIEYAVLAGVLMLVYKAKGGQKFLFSFAEAKKLLSVGRYYILSQMMVVIFAQTDKIMLKHMMDSEAVGYYAAAVTCANMFGFVFTAIIDSARPVIIEAKQRSSAVFERMMTMLYSVVFYLAFAVGIVITLFAPLIIRILYGVEYNAAVAPLRLIVWYIAFSMFGAVRNIWILAEEKQKYLWRINICGAIANVILNAMIIPVWGIMGAALASLVTQFFTNVVVGFLIKPIRPNNRLMLSGMDIRLFWQLVKGVLRRTKDPERR